MTVKNPNIINIHGKDYMTVAGRVQLAHDTKGPLSITTEVLPIQGAVVIKAMVTTEKGTFTGISAANPSKVIEKMSPYEVAETSAVGRALGFAGFGSVEGIATADEMKKSETEDPTESWGQITKKASPTNITNEEAPLPEEEQSDEHICHLHTYEGRLIVMKDRGKGIWDHRSRLNEDQQYDPKGNWYYCQGNGWHLSVNQ